MARILVTTMFDTTLSEINDALDNAGIDYEFDNFDRYLIADEDAEDAITIMESLGADTDII